MQVCLYKQRSKDEMKHATSDNEFGTHDCPKAESHDTVQCHSQWHTAWACYQGSRLLHSTEHGVLACLPSQEALLGAAAVSAGCVWQGVAQPSQQAHTLDAKGAWQIYIFELGHGCNLAASLCASTKQLDFLFAGNLFTCVFACQAQRALASARLRSGWVRKARRVGNARVKARRQPGSPRRRMQMLIAAIFLLSPASWVCVECVCQGNIAAVQPVSNAWSTSRKLRNQLMRAMHGNTMKKANRRQAEESTPSQCIDTSAGSNHVASKKARVADVVDAASSLRAQPTKTVRLKL